jgi:hypothetical protein
MGPSPASSSPMTATPATCITNSSTRKATLNVISGDGGAVSVLIEPAADAGVDAFRPTFLMERVSRYLETLTEPATQTVIERSVEGKIEAVRRALAVLVTEGFVERTPGPRNSLNHALTKPFPGGWTMTPSHPVPTQSRTRSGMTPSPSPPVGDGVKRRGQAPSSLRGRDAVRDVVVDLDGVCPRCGAQSAAAGHYGHGMHCCGYWREEEP